MQKKLKHYIALKNLKEGLQKIAPSSVNEAYNNLSLGYGHSYNSCANQPYFEYKILPLSSNLGQRGYKIFSKSELDTYEIRKGDYISGINPLDEKRHYGVIQRFFIPEGDTKFQWVFILDRDTSEIIPIYPDTIKIAFRDGKEQEE